MDPGRRFAVIAALLGVVSLGHAALTWPPAATLAFFGGGALVTFAAEAVATSRGWLEHHVGPKVAGVPLYVPLAWASVTYPAFRVALLVSAGWTAVALAGVLATAYDVLTDHQGVERGHWSYTDDLPGPRYRGVPWWNFAGWLGISWETAALAVPFL